MTSLTVLGIPVTAEQVAQWLAYYSPAAQPFRARDLTPSQAEGLPTDNVEITDELRDTFFIYGGGPWVWLSERQYAELHPSTRTVLAAERLHRMNPKPAPAWPSDPMVEAKLVRWMEAGVRPSLHVLARHELGRAAAGPLPRAVELAGTFPAGSGPNCFGAVMAATGELVDHDWVQLEQFQTWLDAATTSEPVTHDEGGQVLVWRRGGELAHAAVTLPGGWVLQKPSQSWSSPIGVWTAEETIASWRLQGVRLSRYQLRR